MCQYRHIILNARSVVLFAPVITGDVHLIISSEVANMSNPLVAFRRRAFLNPASTDYTSHILASVQSTNGGGNEWGTNLIYIADSKRSIRLDFTIGTKPDRRRSLAKINLLIDILTGFRKALLKEIELIDKHKCK